MKYLISLLLLLSIATTLHAATYYIRTDGGTKTQCTGLTDAAYSGTGIAQDCAVSHPYWIGETNGFSGGTTTFSGGDTVVIGSGSYAMGYGAPNTSKCPIAGTGCQWPDLPSGTEANPTTIIGCSINGCGENPKPELHAVYKVNTLIRFVGKSWITLKDLELTQHAICQREGTNPPNLCTEGSSSGLHGIFANYSSNVVLDGLYIHRMGSTGIKAGGLTNWTVRNTVLRANTFAGWEGDCQTDTGFTGNFILDNSSIEYSGCSETYPEGEITQCYGQNGKDPHTGESRTGNGEGVGFGNGSIGNWVITDSSISYNTADGFDGLHGRGPGDSVYINRSVFEGNAGNQLKFKSAVEIDNSVIVGDCGYFSDKEFNYGVPHCRAYGATISISMVKDLEYKIYNSTIVQGGDSLILTKGDDCNAGTKLILRNNIWVGGRNWQQDPVANPSGFGANKLTDFYWAGGSDGDGAGTCGLVVPDQDYDIVYGTKNNVDDCTGAHSKCNQDPGFINTILMGPAAVGYTMSEGIHKLVGLKDTSIARADADPSAALMFSSDDFNKYPRGTVWDIGAYQYGSVSTDAACENTPRLCLSQGACLDAGYFFCNGVCQNTPCPVAPSCPSTPALCTQGECAANSLNYCNGTCQAAECVTVDPELPVGSPIWIFKLGNQTMKVVQ